MSLRTTRFQTTFWLFRSRLPTSSCSRLPAALEAFPDLAGRTRWSCWSVPLSRSLRRGVEGADHRGAETGPPLPRRGQDRRDRALRTPQLPQSGELSAANAAAVMALIRVSATFSEQIAVMDSR
jgi:hypothetical protein